MNDTRVANKAARIATVYLLAEAGDLDLEETSQASLARFFGMNRSTALKDLRELEAVTKLVKKYVEEYRADKAAGIF